MTYREFQRKYLPRDFKIAQAEKCTQRQALVDRMHIRLVLKKAWAQVGVIK